MLDCSRMSHRVHTILSILAEDHAPAALRHSILLAIDWPTVAEEAPATGDDASAATLVALRLRGAVTDNHPAIASLAARLATVAASLTTTGDKAMTTHATALWSAATALVGIKTANMLEIRNTLAEEVNGHEHLTVMHMARAAVDTIGGLRDWIGALANKASDIIPGVDADDLGKKATLIATALDRVRDLKTAHDKALADIHALADILKVPEGGNIVDHASAFAERHMRRVDESTAEAHRVNEENTRLRAQVDRMIAAMREDALPPVKPRPQPGDVVPWAEVEDGGLYYRDGYPCKFGMVIRRQVGVMSSDDDSDIERMIIGHFGEDLSVRSDEESPILVARDLGTDPEVWRKAMREWTASESSRPR